MKDRAFDGPPLPLNVSRIMSFYVLFMVLKCDWLGRKTVLAFATFGALLVVVA
jgi:hypothetical protein